MKYNIKIFILVTIAYVALIKCLSPFYLARMTEEQKLLHIARYYGADTSTPIVHVNSHNNWFAYTEDSTIYLCDDRYLPLSNKEKTFVLAHEMWHVVQEDRVYNFHTFYNYDPDYYENEANSHANEYCSKYLYTQFIGN